MDGQEKGITKAQEETFGVMYMFPILIVMSFMSAPDNLPNYTL